MRISDWSSDVCSSDLGLHDDLRWAGGSAIGTDWMTEHKAVWAGTRALAIRHSPYFQAMANGGAAPFRERIGRREIQRTGYRHDTGIGVQMHRSEEHTSELQSLMRISYAVFCLKKKKKHVTRETLIDHK